MVGESKYFIAPKHYQSVYQTIKPHSKTHVKNYGTSYYVSEYKIITLLEHRVPVE